jgi:tetratricopeptide (TPR) repeat protein
MPRQSSPGRSAARRPRLPHRAAAPARPALLLALLAPLALACASASPPPAPAAPQAAGGEVAGPPLRRDPARHAAVIRDLVFDGSRSVRPRPGALPTGEATELLAAARALNEAEAKGEALVAAAAAVVAAPARAEAYEELAEALWRVRELARAEAALRTALRLRRGLGLDPRRVATRLELADLLWMTGRRDAADAEWRRVLAEEPGSGRALVRRAVAAHLRGQPAPAARWAAAAAALGEPLPAPFAHLAEAAAAGGGEGIPGDGAPRPAAPVTAASSAPSTIVVEPAQRLDVGGGHHHSAEPSVAAVRRGDVERVVVGWIDTREADTGGAWRIATASSDDGGRTFTEAMLPAPGEPSLFDGDPTVVADPRSGMLWVGAVSFVTGSRGVWVSRDIPGTSGVEPTAFTSEGTLDRPWLAVGPLPAAPGETPATRLYLTFIGGGGYQHSDDLGASWTPRLPYSDQTPTGAIHLPRVGPGGELYFLTWDQRDAIDLIRSFDGGASFAPPVRIATRLDYWSTHASGHVPGTFRVPPLPVLAVDPLSGALYAMWFDTTRVVAGDADLDLFLSRSLDRGETWSPPRTVLAGAGDQFFPWLEVDSAGRLLLVFFDTSRGGGRDADPAALLDAVFAVSDDGGESWRTAWLTPQPFSTAAASWPSFSGAQFVGDFLGLAPIDEGAFVAYPAASDAGDLDILGQRVRLVAPCDPALGLCLGGGRFQVSVEWSTAAGDSGVGRPRPLTADTGTFWFFDAANLELVVKVLDACPVNGHRWVFAAGLTNVEVRLVVDDLATGARRVYDNPQGTPFAPVQDTAAFTGCP